jgi:hypothetical protein
MYRGCCLILAVFLLGSAIGCAPPSPVTPRSTSATAPVPTATGLGRPTATLTAQPAFTQTPALAPLDGAGLPPAQASIVAAAVADLADRTGADAASIELTNLVADDLPAVNLGCPTKATSAAVQPAFVTGWIITLQVAGAVYEYRAHGGQLVYCGGGSAPS